MGEFLRHAGNVFATGEKRARNKAAAQIRKARSLEAVNAYPDYRGMHEYIAGLEGVRALFSYVRWLDPENPRILGIGEGRMIAARQFAESKTGRGIHFIATGLSHVDAVTSPTPHFTALLTSAEELHGIQDGSISAAIAMYSLAYSKAPALALGRIDQVLRPGGVLKATFRAKKITPPGKKLVNDLQTYGKFLPVLKRMGYDVAIHHEFDPAISDRDVLLAVKPGKNAAKAQTLLDDDIADYHEYVNTAFAVFHTNERTRERTLASVNARNEEHAEWLTHAKRRISGKIFIR